MDDERMDLSEAAFELIACIANVCISPWGGTTLRQMLFVTFYNFSLRRKLSLYDEEVLELLMGTQLSTSKIIQCQIGTRLKTAATVTIPFILKFEKSIKKALKIRWRDKDRVEAAARVWNVR
eukprot:CAMPEP_0194068136 /NCGR_PEP_ID=MMETSP0009_2-20130614/86927_1 /TAXON_ID=210454 /ORGANISM="Grammatophora oceanica, Strain CCMP 410" /LENGTH=121 /DNA_ID=CAMNT_0038721203 /DNA_START=741 /DNA_END=1107 /DNA_ORIENTATION=+